MPATASFKLSLELLLTLSLENIKFSLTKIETHSRQAIKLVGTQVDFWCTILLYEHTREKIQIYIEII